MEGKQILKASSDSRRGSSLLIAINPSPSILRGGIRPHALKNKNKGVFMKQGEKKPKLPKPKKK